jgi:predicted transcriptional regulator
LAADSKGFSLATMRGFFLGETVSIYNKITEILIEPKTAQEISMALLLPVNTIKIAVYTMCKRGKLTREKRDRTGKGPKQEYVYARPCL